ncbi:MAG: hypothetical protein Kow0029_06610 [Candidatus Rifleibacteriota bacterium]
MKALFNSIYLCLLFFSAGVSASACDSSLLQMFASESSEAAFFKQLEAISLTANELGSKSNGGEIDSTALDKLMLLWLNFDKLYRLNPPFWAKKNDKWPEKFARISNQIGEIRQGFKDKNPVKVHELCLSLTRKLNLFVLEAPGGEDKKILATLPLIYNDIEFSYKHKNKEMLIKKTKEYNENVDRLLLALATDSRKLATGLHDASLNLCKLTESIASNSELFSWRTSMYIKMTEEAYIQLNQKLLEVLKKEKGDAIDDKRQ